MSDGRPSFETDDHILKCLFSQYHSVALLLRSKLLGIYLYMTQICVLIFGFLKYAINENWFRNDEKKCFHYFLPLEIVNLFRDLERECLLGHASLRQFSSQNSSIFECKKVAQQNSKFVLSSE